MQLCGSAEHLVVTLSFDLFIFISLDDGDSNYAQRAFVQYYFDGGKELPVPDSKASDMRTLPSVKNDIRNFPKSVGPNAIMEAVKENRGGLLGVESPSDLPRNLTQIKNFRRDISKDELTEILDQWVQEKESNHGAPLFIREIISAPETIVLLATDQQVADLERFCCDPRKFSVLGVDATFNLGNFYVTVTTYKHLLLETKDSKINPVFLGPLLIHQTRNYESYSFLAAGILRLCRNLRNLKAFGSDGEKAIYQAFGDIFPNAVHLRCEIHMRDNVDAKLKVLGISEAVAKEMTADLFGTYLGNEKYKGLVDAESKDEFEAKLESLGCKWSSVHPQGKAFYDYFCKEKAAAFWECMSAEVRIRCGLGYPPARYTQNPNESMNSVLKKLTGNKKMSARGLLALIYGYIKQQQSQAECSIVDHSKYLVAKPYQFLSVDEAVFYRKSVEQKQRLIHRFNSQKVLDDPANQQFDGEQPLVEESANELSVKPCDSLITLIPYPVVTSIFAEARNLILNGLIEPASSDAACKLTCVRFKVSLYFCTNRTHFCFCYGY